MLAGKWYVSYACSVHWMCHTYLLVPQSDGHCDVVPGARRSGRYLMQRENLQVPVKRTDEASTL